MPIAVGQTSKGRTSSGNSVSTTAVNTAASGSTFLIGVAYTSAMTISSVSDNKGNSYTAIGSEGSLAGGERSRLYYCENGTGGASHQATVAASATTFYTVFFVEITGGATSGILDQNNQANDTATPFTSGNVTTTQAAAMLVSLVCGNASSGTDTHSVSGATPTSGWTIQAGAEETDATSYMTGAFKTQAVSSTGTYNGGWGLSASTGATVYIVALKELTAGGTVHDVSISETANATDAFDQGAPFDGDVFDFDVFDIDPTGGGGTTYTRDVAETSSATDSVSALGQLVASVSDAGSAVDTVSALGVFLGAIAEAGSAAESTSALGTFVAALAEAASAVDAPSALVAAVASVSDSGSASEQVSSGSGPSTYNVSVDETAAATEAVSAIGVLLAALAEAGSTNDSVSGALNALAQAIEAGDAQDTLTAGAALLASLGETGAASDILAAPLPPTGDTAPQGSLLVDPGRLLNR